MAISLRYTHMLLAAACLCQALAGSPLAPCHNASASAQGAPTPAQSEQSAQTVQQQPAANSAPTTKEQPERPVTTREDTYREFISDTGIREVNIQDEIRRGVEPVPGRRPFSKCLGIREDAEEAIYTIVVEAFAQIRADEEVVTGAVAYYLQGNKKTLDQTEAEKIYALMQVRNQKQEATIKETIAQLKQKLTQEDFKKLDTYIYALGGGGKERTTKNTTSSALADKCLTPSVTPASQQPQGVQP